MWPWYPHSSLEKHYPPDFVFETKNREINQAVLMYPPKHPVMAKLIDEVVRRIQNAHDDVASGCTLGQSVLKITGPHVYTEVIAKYINHYDFIIHQSNDEMFDGHIRYDGTKGEYHKHIKRLGNSWKQFTDKIIL
jgi:hypothetical protein